MMLVPSSEQLNRIGTIPRSEYRIRLFQGRDSATVCSWVTTAETLRLVSSDTSDRLTPQLLQSWLAIARCGLVVSEYLSDKPVGFCTLTRLELANISSGYIELCHLIVDPAYKYVFVGSRLVRAAEVMAREFGYQFLFGRVVPVNRWGLVLVRFVRAEEFTGIETWAPLGSRWFRLRLKGDIPSGGLGA